MSLYNLTESPSTNKLAHLIEKNREGFHPIVEFNPHSDKLINFNFTANNEELTENLMNDTDKFSAYISNKLSSSGSRYGIGGYGELRTVYNRSQLFDGGKDEPRRVHLGTDIWGRTGEKIYVAIGGMVHSLAYNDHFGDYGATIILLPQLEELMKPPLLSSPRPTSICTLPAWPDPSAPVMAQILPPFITRPPPMCICRSPALPAP